MDQVDQVEASGKTVEDALEQALTKLDATREEVELVVLDEGKKGIFGRGARDAVIRVQRVTDPDAGLKESKRPGAASRRRGGGDGRRGRSRGRPAQGSSPQLERAQPILSDEDFRPRTTGSTREEDKAPEPSRESSRPSRPPADRPHVDPNIEAEEVDVAAQMIDDILQILAIDATITIREPMTPGDGRGSAFAVIDLEGEDLGLLIGRRGDTLYSLQYLVNVALSHRYSGRGSVTVDIEHYRNRRENQVVSLAQRMADRVRRTGSPITLEPMAPAERRLVHLALGEDPEIETNSTGSGDARKVVISLRS
ncbi:MAG TPA: RNA-binding cell elongation regulator Jag/EloR [Dehalococcoidia bacterium]|jgi:spoIIIJ-associated protein|nr:RNA-binding cell elongation regulator Jag/EloR [Dehalococcoidia bacterium]